MGNFILVRRVAEKKKLNPVDLAGIGNLLEYLVVAVNITCEERDRIMLRIAKENDLTEYLVLGFAGYGWSKDEVLKHAAHRNVSVSQEKEQAVILLLPKLPEHTAKMRQDT